MEKLKQPSEGEYFTSKGPVTPILVYGPIMYTYQQIIDNIELPIDFLVEQVREETGVDLEAIADSYTSGEISVTEANNKKTRHEIINFFHTIPKPLN